MAFKRVVTAKNKKPEESYQEEPEQPKTRFKRVQRKNPSLSNFNREGYQSPSDQDPFYDTAKQVPYQIVRGLATLPGNLVDLAQAGIGKGLDYFGAPQKAIDIANYIRNQVGSIQNLPTTESFDEFAKSYGINPNANTEAGRIAGNIAEIGTQAYAGGTGARGAIAAATGEVIGEGADQVGLPSAVGTTARVTSAFAGGSKKGLVFKKSQKPVVDFLRKYKLNDKEITPLIQSSAKVATLSKVALKGEKVSKFAKKIKDKVGQIYEYLKDQSKNYPILTTQQKDTLVSEMFAKRNKIPLVFQKSIDPIIKRFENSKGSIEDLIIFYQDISAATKGIEGGKSVLGTFKPFASKNISMLDARIGREFELTNSLYSKAAKFRKSFKSDLIDKGLNVTELYNLSKYIVTKNYKGLAGIVGKYSARALARELLVNPKLQNLSKRLGIALTENNPNKIKTIIRAIQKESGELEKSDSKS